VPDRPSEHVGELEVPVIARDRSGFRPGEIDQIVQLALRSVAPSSQGSAAAMRVRL